VLLLLRAANAGLLMPMAASPTRPRRSAGVGAAAGGGGVDVEEVADALCLPSAPFRPMATRSLETYFGCFRRVILLEIPRIFPANYFKTFVCSSI
jgi:hypothetical protein